MTTEEEVIETSPKGTQEDGGESNTTCMICMEEWTIGTEHRICCLKCGHLFGRSCIERWIKEKGSGSKCPTCNKPAKRPDLRDLWCKSIKATDNTELRRLQELLEMERQARKTDSAAIFHNNLKIDLLEDALNNLKKDIIEKDSKISKLERVLNNLNKLRAQKLAAGGEDCPIDMESDEVLNLDGNIDPYIEPVQLKGKFHFAQKVHDSGTCTCKSFALCPISSVLLVAQPSPQSSRGLFEGFGLRKYQTLDTNVREFIPLHTKLITSIQLKPFSDLILTASQERKVKLTSVSNKHCIQTYDTQYEPVSVSWSAHRDRQFYVASGNCYVALYDMRNTTEYIYQTDQKIASSRLLSIASTTGPENLNGLLVNDSKGSHFLEVSDSSDFEMETIDREVQHLIAHPLPFVGLMGTVDFNKRLNLALISARKTPINQNNVHHLVKLKKVENGDGTVKIGCETVRTFNGSGSSDLLSQSRILRHPTLDDHVLVCASDHNSRGIKLWDSSDNTEYQTIRTDSYIRDTLMYSPENTNQHVLFTLSESGLSVYRWDSV